MIILGIDPGYAIVGYGVIRQENGKTQAIDCGTIDTSKDLPFPDRLLDIDKGINSLIDKFRPDAIAIEELFFANNQKTAIAVAMARGVIIVAGKRASVPTYEYTPMQVKQALTGYGKADKNQVQQMVTRLLGLAKVPKPDDAADALAIALTHAQTGRLQQLFKVK